MGEEPFDDLVPGEEWPSGAFLPPDDRLWRHPSEMRDGAAAAHQHQYGAQTSGPQARVRPVVLRTSALSAVALLATGGLALTLVMSAARGGAEGSAGEPGASTASADTAARVPTSPAPPGVLAADPGVEASVAALAPAIVEVEAHTTSGWRKGTGVGVRSDGMVLTAESLVTSADRIEVRTVDGPSYSARITGVDDGTDLAVLHVPTLSLPTVRFAKPGDGGAGQLAICVSITRPDAPLEVSVGKLLMVDVRAEMRDGRRVLAVDVTGAWDSASDPGGVLIDADGNVLGIGIGTGAHNGRQDLVFESSRFVPAVATALMESGELPHGWVGIEGEDVQPEPGADVDMGGERTTTSALPLSSGHPGSGVVVSGVEPGSGAARAGIREGDVIVSMNGGPVQSLASLQEALYLLAPGTLVSLGIWRQGHEIDVPVTLSAS